MHRTHGLSTATPRQRRSRARRAGDRRLPHAGRRAAAAARVHIESAVDVGSDAALAELAVRVHGTPVDTLIASAVILREDSLEPHGIDRRQHMTDHEGLLDASESARLLLQRIDALVRETSGGFWHANGERLPW